MCNQPSLEATGLALWSVTGRHKFNGGTMETAIERIFTHNFGDNMPVDQDNTCDICGAPVENGSICNFCRELFGLKEVENGSNNNN
jgi:hypothetical protein